MRIAIDGSAWGYSRGFGRYTRELARALVRVAPERDWTLLIDRSAAGRDDFPEVPRIVLPAGRAGREAGGPEDARPLRDMGRTARALSRFDGVVFPTHTAFVPVPRRCRVALVVQDAIRESQPVAGVSLADRLRWRAKTWLACRAATVLAAPSEASARAIRERLPIGRKRVVVLGAGADPVFSPGPDPEDARLTAPWVPAGARVVLYVGGLGAHKRVPDLIRAFGRFASAAERSDAVLVLVGAEQGASGERAALEDTLDAIGPVRSRVVRTGFVPDRTLAALYRAAGCVVLPAAAEGFGLPALEAMASGAAVLAARIPALEEVCGDVAAYFERPADMAGAIGRILADAAGRAERARRGPERAASFGWDVAARRLLAAWDGRAPDPPAP